jgi:hypothetical protein
MLHMELTVPPNKKFTTGLIVDYFKTGSPSHYQAIAGHLKSNNIDEALAIILPFLTNEESEFDWESRVDIAEKRKYLNGQKQYDVWYQPLTTETSNSEYLANVYNDLKGQYSHQQQIVIFNVLEDPLN